MIGLPLRALFFSALLVSSLNPFGGEGELNRVRTANRLVAEAQVAYAAGRDGAAIDLYERLGELGPLPEPAQLNLAHAHFRAGHRTQARAAYAALSASASLPRRAVALHQLGLLAAAERDYDRALPLLRAALRLAPTHRALRASYETLARWLAVAGPQDDNPPPGGLNGPRRPQPRPGTAGEPRPADTRPAGPGSAPQGTGDQPGGGDRPTEAGNRTDQLGQGRQPGDQRGFGNEPGGGADGPAARPTGGTAAATDAARRAQTLRARQPDATIPPAQARMLLEAMQAAETQYLQQLPRPARRPADPTRPDW